ncbi:MAG TPA: hypothetical protein PLU53_08145, partial [Bacteroidia bacterium]|nr:hypothetical protein [Bacteroidia bacterium]
QILKGFDDWVNLNPAQPQLCLSVRTEFVRQEESEKEGKKDTVRWSEAYRLNWEDFKSPVDRNSPFSAQSHCLFDYKAVPSFNNQVMVLTISLFACFAKKSSWVQADKKQESLLAHEQLHFDICELYIRQLRKKISGIKLDILEADNQLKVLFEEAWKGYQEAQNLYDEETEHGIIADKQESWAVKISAQLSNLKEFARD